MAQPDEFQQQTIDEQRARYPEIRDDELGAMGGWDAYPEQRYLSFVYARIGDRSDATLEREVLLAHGVDAIARGPFQQIRLYYWTVGTDGRETNDRVEETTEMALRQWIVDYLRQQVAANA